MRITKEEKEKIMKWQKRSVMGNMDDILIKKLIQGPMGKMVNHKKAHLNILLNKRLEEQYKQHN